MTYRDLSELPKGSLTHDEAVSIAQAMAAGAFETIGVFRSAMGDFSLEGRYWYAGGVAVKGLDEPQFWNMLAHFVLTESPPSAEALYRHVTARGVPLDPLGYFDLPLCIRTAFEVFVRSLPPLAGEAARADAARRAAEEAAKPKPAGRRFKTIFDQPRPDAKIWDPDEDMTAPPVVVVAEPKGKTNGKAVRV